jgi:hypothetical protein
MLHVFLMLTLLVRSHKRLRTSFTQSLGYEETKLMNFWLASSFHHKDGQLR